MKLFSEWILFFTVLFVFGSCNNVPTPEELAMAAKGKSAILINQPDPESLRLEKVAEQYEIYIKDKMEEYQLPGLAYAIVKDGQILSMNTFGYRKNGTADSINEHTVFRLASVSKGFASVLAGLLVDKGYIGWNDKIIDHLPKFKLSKPYNTNKMTIRHSLSQTSGLTKYGGASYIYQGLTYPSILKKMRNVRVESKPAQVFAYQNAMFSVISEVAKSATERTYEELMDSMIFMPLGMNDASLGYKAMMKTENKGMPHVRSKKKWKAGNIRKNWYNVAPAAGVNASISDMSVWLNAMLGHHPDVIPQEVLDQVFTRHIPINDDSDYYQTWFPGLAQASYGMGWRIFDYNNHKIIYHGGFVRGYRPEIGLCPKEDVGIVFLTNSSKNDLSSACVRAFFDMYFAPKISI